MKLINDVSKKVSYGLNALETEWRMVYQLIYLIYPRSAPTKLDETFQTAQFFIDGFSEPYRRDRTKRDGGGGVMIYVREDIPSKLLSKYSTPDDIEGMFVELNFRKSKWLLYGTYHPPKQKDVYYFTNVGNALEFYNKTYDKCLLAGDLNAQIGEDDLDNFMAFYGIKSIVHDKTCFKSLTNPSCVDLFLTNSNKSFQNTVVISAGMSDYHKMVVTVLKTTFPKSKPKEIVYRSYKSFDRDVFRAELKEGLKKFFADELNYDHFENTFLSVLNKHAPIKKKIVRANEGTLYD